MGKKPSSAGFVVNQTVTVFAFLVLFSSLALATGSGTEPDPYVFNPGENGAAGLVSTSAPDYWKLVIPGKGRLLVQLSQGNVKMDVSFPNSGESINDNNARFYDITNPGEARFKIYTASSTESNYLFTAYYTSPPPEATTGDPSIQRNCWPIGFPSCLQGTPIVCKEDAIGNTDWEQQTGSCSATSTNGCPEGQPLCSAGTSYVCQSNEWKQTGTCNSQDSQAQNAGGNLVSVEYANKLGGGTFNIKYSQAELDAFVKYAQSRQGVYGPHGFISILADTACTAKLSELEARVYSMKDGTMTNLQATLISYSIEKQVSAIKCQYPDLSITSRYPNPSITKQYYPAGSSYDSEMRDYYSCVSCVERYKKLKNEVVYKVDAAERYLKPLDDASLGLFWFPGVGEVFDILSGVGRTIHSLWKGEYWDAGFYGGTTLASLVPFIPGAGLRKVGNLVFKNLDEVKTFLKKLGVPETAVTKTGDKNLDVLIKNLEKGELSEQSGVALLKKVDSLGEPGQKVLKGSINTDDFGAIVSEGASADELVKGSRKLEKTEEELRQAANNGKIFDYAVKEGDTIKGVSVKRARPPVGADNADSKIRDALSDINQQNNNLPGTTKGKPIVHFWTKTPEEKAILEQGARSYSEQAEFVVSVGPAEFFETIK